MKAPLPPRLLWGIIFLLALLLNCEEKITGERSENIPPETSVFVQSEDTLNFTQSTQTIHWDGQDEDGFVVGFYYTFLENPQPDDWVWTTERSETFPLKITGQDTIYQFQVKAVDNQDAEDPSPAKQLFPIKNSPPSISWSIGSTIPDTTFTIASFSWQSGDPDGDTTISHYEYSLDSIPLNPNNWLEIPRNRSSITLDDEDGITEGEHAFYLRAVDIAGATSPTIRMPENPNKNWFVKIPQGRYLLIDDYETEDNNSRFPDAYYKSMLNDIIVPAGEEFTYWNIEELFPASSTQFTETMKLFERVIWYNDLVSASDPHFITAQIAIPEFRQTGGKIIYSVWLDKNFGVQGDPLAFSPADSLDRANILFTNTNDIVRADTLFSNTFPQLQSLPTLSPTLIIPVKAMFPKPTSIPIYRMDRPDSPLLAMVGQNDNTGAYDFIFSTIPFHFLRGNNNLNDFFEIILLEFFEP